MYQIVSEPKNNGSRISSGLFAEKTL